MINFDKLRPRKTKFGILYDSRLFSELNKLNENDAITVEECGKLLGVSAQRIWQLINESSRWFRAGKWNIDLRSLLISSERYKMIEKQTLAEIFKFLEHKQILKELKENKQAYRKAMQNKFGNVSFATKACLKANYNCDICINQNACSIANNKPFVKRLTTIMKILENNSFEPQTMSRISDLEKLNIKLQTENSDLKIKILELQKALLKVKKELIASY